MASVNKVIIVGNVGRDPEVRETPNGSKVANFSIATTERYNDQQGNRQEKTEWHNLVAWGKNAETIQQFVQKGSSLYIEGSLATRSWDDQATGQKKYKTEIVVRSFQFLSNKGQSDNNISQGGQAGYSASTQDFGGAPAPEDDLPF